MISTRRDELKLLEEKTDLLSDEHKPMSNLEIEKEKIKKLLRISSIVNNSKYISSR
jgi:hypothetical protein